MLNRMSKVRRDQRPPEPTNFQQYITTIKDYQTTSTLKQHDFEIEDDSSRVSIVSTEKLLKTLAATKSMILERHNLVSINKFNH